MPESEKSLSLKMFYYDVDRRRNNIEAKNKKGTMITHDAFICCC